AAAGAAVARDPGPGDVQVADVRDQLERKRILGPVLVDDGSDLGRAELAHLLQDRELLGAEGLVELVEITVRRRQRLWLDLLCCDHSGFSFRAHGLCNPHATAAPTRKRDIAPRSWPDCGHRAQGEGTSPRQGGAPGRGQRAGPGGPAAASVPALRSPHEWRSENERCRSLRVAIGKK